MVEWIAFVQVAAVTVAAALVIVGLYGLGVRLQAVAEDEGRNRSLNRFGSWVCFVISGCVVLFGIVLIVPALSKAIGL